jgi:four helix bundle protein
MARELTKKIYGVTTTFPFKSDYRFCGQIQAASLSVGSNIAEGFERGTQPEFIRFLTIAKGSCAEVRSQLYSAFDVGYINESLFTTLLRYAEEVGNVIGGLKQSAIRKGKK